MSKLKMGDIVRPKGQPEAEIRHIIFVDPTSSKPIKCVPASEFDEKQDGASFLHTEDFRADELEYAWKTLVPNERRDVLELVHRALSALKTHIPASDQESAFQEAVTTFLKKPGIRALELEKANEIHRYDEVVAYLANPKVDLAEYILFWKALAEIIRARTGHVVS